MDNDNKKQKPTLEQYLGGLKAQQGSSTQCEGDQMDTLERNEVDIKGRPKGTDVLNQLSSTRNRRDGKDDDEVTLSQSSTTSSVLRNEMIETINLIDKGNSEEVSNMSKAVNDLDLQTTSSELSQETIKPRRERLNGAAKRRLKYLIGKGMDEETARIKCKEPMSAKSDNKGQANLPSRGGKRNRSDTTVTPQADKKAKTNHGAIPKTTTQRPSYSEMAASVKIGIIPATYPDRKLTEEEIIHLRREVLQLIYEQRDQTVKPRFTQGASAKSGWMIFHCADEETANWLRTQALWVNEELVAINEDRFPNAHVLVGYFKHSAEESSDFILGVVKGQNDDLDTSSWKVLNRRNDGHLAILAVEVNDTAFNTLKTRDFLVHYAYGQKVRLKPKVKMSEEEPVPSSSSTPKTIPESGTQDEERASTSSGSAATTGLTHRAPTQKPNVPKKSTLSKPGKSYSKGSQSEPTRRDENRGRRDSKPNGRKSKREGPNKGSKRSDRK